MIKIGQRYKHFKGNVITILNVAKHSETLEDMVIYEHDNKVWARPLSMFLDKEDVSNRPDNITGQKYRFEYLEEE
ncbi:MAG: DUF1653 domain-containing protein [Firmicutes bacterium]|nr:DUF1653 domain-containing protein [Bacillota bacterium]